jgi:S-DNA-T family DNA segregation ATPase FtsK/SpoIIIE
VAEPGAEVIPLYPDADDDAIVEGEIVDSDPAPPAARTLPVPGPRTQAAGRHAAYVVLGAAVVARRTWDSRSGAGYDRWIRCAEADGDHARLLELEARRAAFRRDRHARRMDWLQAPAHVAAAVPKVTGALLLALLVIGLALGIATRHIGRVWLPFVTAAKIIAFLVAAVSAGWAPFTLTALAAGLVLLWRAGRRHAHASSTGWLAVGRPQGGDQGLVVTCDAIVVALQHLRVAELQKALKDGWRPEFTLPPIEDGQGYAAILSLPMGVTAQMVADQRPVLARNLQRAEVEVWPTDAERDGAGPPGTMALWVANRGALSRPAPEYPLLHEGTADVFEGVPGGVTARGHEITIPVVSNNFVLGGQMGQGKSNGGRVLMLGCSLDPIADLGVFVFAANGDFDAYAPRLSRYHKGDGGDVVTAAMDRLEWLYGEVARREGRLAELGAKKVTRGLALANPDLYPIVDFFSECHELYGSKEFGPLAAELSIKTIKRARKTGITLGFDTQSSRKAAIPPELVELVSVNCCFYVKTWRSNDGFLGDGSFQAGIRATKLRPGRDRGTSVTTGVSDAQFELLRWYYIEVGDDTGYDAAAEVIARAVASAAPGTIASAPPVAALEARDLLADLAAVTGHERVKLADLPARLRELAPAHREYRSLNGTVLRGLLEDEGVRVTNTGNVPRLDPADLHRALAGRGE